MKYKLVPNLFFVLIVLIVGGALLDQFDFQNLKFEKPALAAVYFIAIVISIGLIVRKSKSKEQESTKKT